MISLKFTTEFINSRVSWYNEEGEYEALNSFFGDIQQSASEVANDLNIAYTKAYTIWCGVDVNVDDGDTLESGTDVYTVRAVKRLNFGKNKHKQLFVEKQQNYG